MKPAPLKTNGAVRSRKQFWIICMAKHLSNEVKACCDYEYARTSKTFRQARRLLHRVRGLKRRRGF